MLQSMCGELTSTSSLGSDQDSNVIPSDHRAQILKTTPLHHLATLPLVLHHPAFMSMAYYSCLIMHNYDEVISIILSFDVKS